MTKVTSLRDHVLGTYVNLRRGMAILAILLPLILGLGGLLLAGLPLQQSMSAYYHAGGGAMRDAFVGSLIALGAFLVLYRGYTTREDRVLNMAGAFLILTALFPMNWSPGGSGRSPHGVFAILFFVSIAYVCLFCANTIDLVPLDSQLLPYRLAYRILGVLMVALPLVAVALSYLIQPNSAGRYTILFVEAAGIWVFGTYWLVKTLEVKQSCADVLAVEGVLVAPQLGSWNAFREFSLGRSDVPEWEGVPLPPPEAKSTEMRGDSEHTTLSS